MSAVAGASLPDAPPLHGVPYLLVRRTIDLIVIIAALTAISALALYRPAQSTIAFCCHYSPARFVHGRVWTLFGSALLPPKLDRIGRNTMVLVAIFVPYTLARGAWKAAGRFFAGHVLATLAVAALVLPGAALGWRFAVTVEHTLDYGVSAGLAAVGGAFAVVLWHRFGAIPASALIVGVVAFFTMHLVEAATLGLALAEFEHLIAASVGAVIELRTPRGTAASRPHRTLLI